MTGYSISIKALDEASAQIKRINTALKDLEKLDNTADQKTGDNARKSKGLFDELNKGVTAFGKNAKTELLALSKHFGEVGGKIGLTIDALGKAFNLKGAAIGLGVATVAAVGIERAMKGAADHARDLVNRAASLGLSGGALQKVQALNRLYNISDQTTVGMLEHIQGTAFAASRGQNNQVADYFRTHGMADYKKMAPDQIYRKMLDNLQHLDPKDSKAIAAWKEVMVALTGSEAPIDIVTRGSEKLAENLKWVDKNFTLLTDDTLKSFDKLSETITKLEERFGGLWTKIENTFGKPLADLLVGAGEKLEGLFDKLEKSGALDRLKKEIEKLFNAGPLGWASRAMGVTPANEGEDDAVKRMKEDFQKDPEGARKKYFTAPGGTGGEAAPIPGASGIPASPGASGVPSPSGTSAAPGKGSDASPTGSGRAGAGVSHAVSADVTREGKALLDTIAGTESPGYNVMYGGSKFGSYTDHPGKFIPITRGPNAGKSSSAAGRYQFLLSTWRKLKSQLGLGDFSPANQDKAGWHLAQTEYRRKTGRDLQGDLANHRYDLVGPALHSQWTSLPGGIEQGTSNKGFTNRFNKNLSRYPAADIMTAKPPVPEKKPEPQPADSSHSVDVTFNNMPTGSRVNVADARGDASLNIRTRYAMGVV